MQVQDIEYNTEREQLVIPEYGRHIQKMVNYAITIEDKEERNKVAKAIIGVMGNMQPHLRDVPDFQHKLWDQLFIISKFKLDVEAPYPILTEEELMQRPDPLEYPQNHPKYRFYGNNIIRMINVANSWEDSDLKEALIPACVNCPLTFPADNPDRTLDYILLNDQANDQFEVLDCQTVNETYASDHLPLDVILKKN